MFLPLADDTPRSRFPTVTLALIALNTAVFVYQITLSPMAQLALIRSAGALPWELARFRDLIVPGQPHALVPPPLTIFTSMFLHGGLLHLAGNMWFLWLFGSKLEGAMGPLRFGIFYFLLGATAALLQTAAAPNLTSPMIGASGAIAGVLGAYALTFPQARVRCLVLVLFFVTSVALPALVILGLWLLAQLAFAQAAQGEVAWSAHVGGFVAGLLAARLFVRAPRTPQAISQRA